MKNKGSQEKRKKKSVYPATQEGGRTLKKVCGYQKLGLGLSTTASGRKRATVKESLRTPPPTKGEDGRPLGGSLSLTDSKKPRVWDGGGGGGSGEESNAEGEG